MDLAIVVNQKALNASALASYLEAFAEARINYTLYQTEPQLLEKVIQTCSQKYPFILVGGGDGTVRTAAQYCVNSKTVLGVLPLGTLNHFVKELLLPMTPEEVTHAVLKKKCVKVDVAELNGHIFLNNSSVGFYPQFAKKRDYHHRFYNKWLSYIPSFFESWQCHPVYELHVQSKDKQFTVKSSFFMVSNNLYAYSFPFSIQRESFKKGCLGVYYFKHGKFRVTKMLKYYFNRKNNFEVFDSKHPVKIEITGAAQVPVSLDGETMKIDTPLVYRTLPRALSLLSQR